MSYEPVPLLWYDKADCEGQYDGGLNYSYFSRVQATAKFTDSRGTTRVVIGRMIFDPYSDFCGGAIARSPQVITMSPGDWGREDHFYDAGVTTAIEPNLRWDHLRDGTFPCPNLNNILGQQAVSTDVAERWAWYQLALSIPTYSRYNHKRMVHCNGNIGGKMARIITMLREQNNLGVMAPSLVYASGQLGGPSHSAHYRGAVPNYTRSWRCSFHETGTFINPNSGRACNAWCLLFSWDEDYEDDELGGCDCEDCRAARGYASEGESPIPDHIMAEVRGPYTNVNFSRVLTRPTWRNG